MEKRYQVFISSTFADLEEERQEVMHALLELDCIPSGMELFPAANEAQWDLIKKVIDDCDYYVLIVAGRYGTIGPGGLSYTEMEYEYAVSKNKPTIGFLHRDPSTIAAGKTESTDEGKAKLRAFRTSVERKLCKHWETPHELGSVVSRSLVQLMKSIPAVGWVRADELADREATLELLKLRRQVDELEAELSKARTSAPLGSEELAQGEDRQLIRFAVRYRLSKLDYKIETRRAQFRPSWNKIFSTVAPLMIHETAESQLRDALNTLIGAESRNSIQEQTGASDVIGFSIDDDDFHTVKVQLRALGLISQSAKARSVKDTATYWTLTPYGDEVMTRLRAIRRSAAGDPEVDEGGEIVESGPNESADEGGDHAQPTN